MMCIWLYTSVSYRKIRHFDHYFFYVPLIMLPGKIYFSKFFLSFLFFFFPFLLIFSYRFITKSEKYAPNNHEISILFQSLFLSFPFFFSQMKIIFPYPPLHQLSTFIYRSYKYKDRIKFHPQFLKNLSSPITTPKQISFNPSSQNSVHPFLFSEFPLFSISSFIITLRTHDPQ